MTEAPPPPCSVDNYLRRRGRGDTTDVFLLRKAVVYLWRNRCAPYFTGSCA